MGRYAIFLVAGMSALLFLSLGSRKPASSSKGMVSALNLVPRALVQLQTGLGGALVVDKSRARLTFFDAVDGQVVPVKDYKIASGKHHGNKLYQGDNRTPEGIYFFTEFKPKAALLPKYGTGAFVMDYPNTFDRILGKTGGGIWLHGTNQEYRVGAKFDSEGCVVVENEDLGLISPSIRLMETPIVIYNEMPFGLAEEQEMYRAELSSFLENWRRAWETKDIDGYMKAYSQKNFQSRGMNWAAWKSYKGAIYQQSAAITVEAKDPRIYVFHPYAYIVFNQTYISSTINDTGTKRLGLMMEGAEWKIVDETFFKTGADHRREISGDASNSAQRETL